jgi:hypothetical protein
MIRRTEAGRRPRRSSAAIRLARIEGEQYSTSGARAVIAAHWWSSGDSPAS